MTDGEVQYAVGREGVSAQNTGVTHLIFKNIGRDLLAENMANDVIGQKKKN